MIVCNVPVAAVHAHLVDFLRGFVIAETVFASVDIHYLEH